MNRPVKPRVIFPCLLSLLVYLVLFAGVLDRPLSLGTFRSQIEARLDRGAEIEGRKLVIIAGSNGPYSHRCETMEPMLGVACVNAGIAVGIGLDYMFARWEPLLHSGDTVYLPLEEAQYTRTATAASVGPDASIMFRHDWSTLSELSPNRRFGAAFSFAPRAALMSVIETAFVWRHFADPRAATIGSSNAWGDHVGHTWALGEANAAHLATVTPNHETPADIRSGDGTAIVRDFISWCERHGVRVIGGLPADFAESPMPEATRAAIRDLFTAAGAHFIDFGERAHYPRSAFFDTPDHLNEAAQIAHSRLVAEGLVTILSPERTASR
jgi:hypothetical protein